MADPAAESAVLADLDAVREHLVIEEQRGLGEWIRDLPLHHLGDFLADMELIARQADADSDIGALISALADWQTTADVTEWVGTTVKVTTFAEGSRLNVLI